MGSKNLRKEAIMAHKMHIYSSSSSSSNNNNNNNNNNNSQSIQKISSQRVLLE